MPDKQLLLQIQQRLPSKPFSHLPRSHLKMQLVYGISPVLMVVMGEEELWDLVLSAVPL
jgi:hypothetical protein